jgi:hypothetical protein
MKLFDRYIDQRVQRAIGQHRSPRIVSSFVHPDIEELMGIEARGWKMGMGELLDSGVPTAGLGFAGPPLPNTEPVNAPSAVTGVTAETNLYTPATTTNADWALIPQGGFRSPQAWLVLASGIITSSAGSQTCAFTSRIGTSATPATNVSLGATGLIALGSTITNALWTYQAQMTIRSAGTSGSAVATAELVVSQQAAGSVTSVGTALSGNTTATIDTTLQQGYVVSVTPSATGVSAQLTQFCLIALD